MELHGLDRGIKIDPEICEQLGRYDYQHTVNVRDFNALCTFNVVFRKSYNV